MENQEVQGKVKKPFYKKVWFWVVVVLVVGIGACSGGSGSSKDEPQKTGSVETTKEQEDTSSADASKEVAEVEPEASEQEVVEEEPVDNMFAVGDIVETDDLKISFISAEEYVSDNQFMQPAEGKVYYRMEFEFENIGDTDQAVSSMMNWSCYADSYAADQTWIGDDGLDATISPGKKAKGAIYFEVPADAAEITVEYETNFWTESKIIFVVK